MRPNVYLLIARTWQGFRGIQIIMTKLRFVLLATTALAAMQLIASTSHAQDAPLIVAQREELGPDGKPKQRPAPPAAAPPAARPAPPAARPGLPPRRLRLRHPRPGLPLRRLRRRLLRHLVRRSHRHRRAQLLLRSLRSDEARRPPCRRPLPAPGNCRRVLHRQGRHK